VAFETYLVFILATVIYVGGFLTVNVVGWVQIAVHVGSTPQTYFNTSDTALPDVASVCVVPLTTVCGCGSQRIRHVCWLLPGRNLFRRAVRFQAGHGGYYKYALDGRRFYLTVLLRLLSRLLVFRHDTPRIPFHKRTISCGRVQSKEH